MCGIVGIWNKHAHTDRNVLCNMRNTLQHRGPDDQGIYIDEHAHVGLGHQRLSIIDLSKSGHQPMERDNHVITFNGEIYNYKELRAELESKGYTFTSNSDTEVLLRAYEVWGTEVLERLRGMFAFAIWDKRKQKMFLCRDRAGVKPLYYYADDKHIIFASEVGAIVAHPDVKKEIDFETLAAFLQTGYISAPQTIYKNIHALEPGHMLTIDTDYRISKRAYWQASGFFDGSAVDKSDAEKNESQIISELEELLRDSFLLRQVSDVPTGVFLSGGIDSSLVVALLQAHSEERLQTFTVGFEDEAYNEAEYAKKIADYCGTDHHELYCTSNDAKEVIPLLPKLFDQPFGDSSAIPTYLVSKFAREHITVALSADGGDELFGGYRRYAETERLFRTANRIPPFLAEPTQTALHFLNETALNQFGAFARRIKLAEGLLANRLDFQETYRYLRSRWTDAEVTELLNVHISAPSTQRFQTVFAEVAEIDMLSQMQAVDFATYLPDNILTKTDRATMAVGLEGREPFLDQHIIEYAAALPASLRRKHGESKYILKQILANYVPKELTDRPKQGFGVPIGSWLRTDLRCLIDEYLSDERIVADGIFNLSAIQQQKKVFLEHNGGHSRIWNILMFQMWKEYWKM